MDSPIRVLIVTIGDGNFGGVASFLYTYYNQMDHRKVHFDFLYCGENSMQSKEGDPVLKGSTITTLHILKKNNNGVAEYKKLILALERIFDEKQYDIVHVNSGNPYLNACVAYVLKGRMVYIAHSHNTQSTIVYGSRVKHFFKNKISESIHRYIVKKADVMCACSNEAGEDLFGKKGIKSEKFRVINNAVDISRFSFDPEKRKEIRRTEDQHIIGFVGRLSPQKNPVFIIDIFAEIMKRKEDTVLWMVGEGELRETVESKIKALGLQKNIHMLGRRNDVADLMQAMDIMLFPSIFEGFGIVAVEAQCAGLRVVASDIVPQEANVAGLVTYLSLKESASYWAEEVIRLLSQPYERVDMSKVVQEANYDIVNEARKLESLYHDLYARHKC